MSDQIDQLLELACELRKLDPQKRVFGAKREGNWGHDYKLYRCLTLREIEAFEHKHDLLLPEDYRQYLLRMSDGGAGPNYGVRQLNEAAEYSNLSIPFPWISETDLTSSSDEEYDLWETGPGILNISERGCGYIDFLIVRGEQRGQIWSDFDRLLTPISMTFTDWYRDWAERCIKTIKREPLLKQIRVGMSVDEVREILGTEMQRWDASQRLQNPTLLSDDYYIGFTYTNASFTIGPNDRVKNINYMGFI